MDKIIEKAKKTLGSRQPTSKFMDQYPFIKIKKEKNEDDKMIAIFESKSRNFYIEKNDLSKIPAFIEDLLNSKTKSELKEDRKQNQYDIKLNKSKKYFIEKIKDKESYIKLFSEIEKDIKSNTDFLFLSVKESIVEKYSECVMQLSQEQIEHSIYEFINSFQISTELEQVMTNKRVRFNSFELLKKEPSIIFSESFDKFMIVELLKRAKQIKIDNKQSVILLDTEINVNLQLKYSESLIDEISSNDILSLNSVNDRVFDQLTITENDINLYVKTIFERTTETLHILDDDELLRKTFYQDFFEKIVKIKKDKVKLFFNLHNKDWDIENIKERMIFSLMAQVFDVKERRLIGFKSSMSRKIIRKNIDIDNFKSLFPKARLRDRKLIFIQGETNSGKTYTAFEMAINSASGLYAAPLRLLALEGQQEFAKRGISCSMLTGEERDEVEGATFVSSTVEMIDYSKEYEVAIIDEVQLINDPDRGHAWLEAIIGVNAKKVILVGSPDIFSVVKELSEYLEEELEVKTFERKTKLEFKKELFNDSIKKTGKLPPHSAVIAFSKKDVLVLKTRFEKCGNTVSVIYGALPPQVRRVETNRFVNGETDVVIATDAIGMGLNLPIENIFFYKTEKFNGKEIKPLEPALVKQIVGRAGRFNQFDIGYVSALTEQAFNFVEKNFYKDTTVIEKELQCSPNYAIINQVHELTQEQSISKLLQNYNNAIKFDFEIKNHMNEHAYMIARFVDDITDMNHEFLSLYEKVKLVNAPISMDRAYKVFDYYKSCIKNIITLRADLEIHPITLVYDKVSNIKPETQTQTELAIKKIDLLSWLSFNFEEFSCLQLDIQTKRQELNDMLIGFLRYS